VTVRKNSTIAAEQFKAQCLELLDRVAQRGESFVITKRGVPVARLVPVVEKRKSAQGLRAGKIHILGDIVSPLDVEWSAERD
jgi:prevent-host-death family protein